VIEATVVVTGATGQLFVRIKAAQTP